MWWMEAAAAVVWLPLMRAALRRPTCAVADPLQDPDASGNIIKYYNTKKVYKIQNDKDKEVPEVLHQTCVKAWKNKLK